MHCEISGREAIEPFVSRSGHVFERALIKKHLEQSETCPVTGEPLNFDELIAVKVSRSVPPRTTDTAGIPQLLQLFQSEWDSTMLETFALKKQLDTVRQELAHALYKQDASCRVIARLMQERDEARAALAAAQASGAAAAPSGNAVTGLSADVKEGISKLSAQLTAERKTRNVPAPAADVVSAYKQVASHSVHKSSQPGVLAVDISPSDQNLIVTGGVDQTAVVFNKQTKKKLATLSGHGKPVTQVVVHPRSNLVLTGSADATARVWNPSADKSLLHTIDIHSAPITAVQLHGLNNGQYFLTASEDMTWGFHNVETGRTLAHARDSKITSAITSAHIHPDCVLLASGCADGTASIWDIRSQTVVAGLGSSQDHAGGVRSIRCSDNGFYLVSASRDVVNLWDLRTCKTIKQVQMAGEEISSVDIAFSGKYVAVGGKAISLFTTADLQKISTLADHTQAVTAVKWSMDGSFLTSVSLDRSLKFYSS